MEKKINETLKRLESPEPSGWKEDAGGRLAEKGWRKKSFQIAFLVAQTLKVEKKSQKYLAEKLGISEQAVSKLLSGRENLTLETIEKLESALGISLIQIGSLAVKAA